MFFGSANHVLDDKGRLAIPAKYRPMLAEGLALTIGLDKCLYILTLTGFNKLVEELEFHSKFNADARALRRSFFPNVELTTLDKQGRIIIPENHRIYASITSNVVIAGLNTYIEIWDQELWDAEQVRSRDNVSDLAQHLSTLLTIASPSSFPRDS